MFNLWGEMEDIPLIQRTTRPKPHPRDTSIRSTALDCFLYGHSWKRIGLSGEKRCTVCGEKGYCPGCTPQPPQGANPYYCSRHAPSVPQEEPRS